MYRLQSAGRREEGRGGGMYRLQSGAETVAPCELLGISAVREERGEGRGGEGLRRLQADMQQGGEGRVGGQKSSQWLIAWITCVLACCQENACVHGPRVCGVWNR